MILNFKVYSTIASTLIQAKHLGSFKMLHAFVLLLFMEMQFVLMCTFNYMLLK